MDSVNFAGNVVDGCFMLEILHFNSDGLNDYGPDDPIFSKHGKLFIMPYIRRDMLVPENQLPMLVLERLLPVERGAETVTLLNLNSQICLIMFMHYKIFL